MSYPNVSVTNDSIERRGWIKSQFGSMRIINQMTRHDRDIETQYLQ